MKKIILAATAIVITFTANAQSTSIDKASPDVSNAKRDANWNTIKKEKTGTVYPEYEPSQPDGVMMKEGKMIKIKAGYETELKEYIIMRNGTRVMSDGAIFTRRGSMLKMKEGQHMDMMGNVTKMKTLPVKKEDTTNIH